MKLSDYIMKNGLKQSFFADKIGVSKPYMSRLVRGTTVPALFMAITIEKQSGGEVTVYDWGVGDD